MMKKLCTALLICLAASACSETTKVSDDLEESQTDSANPTGRLEREGSSPGEQPVRIGEGGPRFSACQGAGRVANLRGDEELAVLIAPFASAESKDSLTAGQFVHICSRSHDQQWMGVVYSPTPAEGEEAIDCGVSSPVRTKRNYDGPCKSGWVDSAYVRLVAG